jgi:cytochrome P450
MYEREKSFAVLRGRDTITWHQPFEDQLIDHPQDYGFWAVTRYDDLVEVTKRHDDFLSGPGILMENLPVEFVESAQSIIGMDPPRHTTLRRLVAAAFTPKQMRRIDEMIQRNAHDAVTNLLEKAQANGGQADFVAECAELMPMNNINDMLGVPDGDRQRAMHEMKVATSWSDPEVAGETKEEVLGNLVKAIAYCHELAGGLADQRRGNPTADLISGLANAEVDGEHLTAHEIGAFFVLLTVAAMTPPGSPPGTRSRRLPTSRSSEPGCWKTSRAACPAPWRSWSGGRPPSSPSVAPHPGTPHWVDARSRRVTRS